jgi:hypothetical protein
MTNPEYAGAAALLLRLALGIMFYAHAWLKIKVFTPAGTVKYFESLGVPGFFAYLTMAAEIGGGTLLILGIETRWSRCCWFPSWPARSSSCMEKKAGSSAIPMEAGNSRRSGSSACSRSRCLGTGSPRWDR